MKSVVRGNKRGEEAGTLQGGQIDKQTQFMANSQFCVVTHFISVFQFRNPK